MLPPCVTVHAFTTRSLALVMVPCMPSKSWMPASPRRVVLSQVITETFSASFAEMLHLLMVLAVTVQFFAMTAQLLFGCEVPATTAWHML